MKVWKNVRVKSLNCKPSPFLGLMAEIKKYIHTYIHKRSLSQNVTYLDVFRNDSQQLDISRLGSLGRYVDIVKHAMDDTEDGYSDVGWTLFKHLHKECKHVKAQMGIRVVEVLDNALGPLKTFLAKRPSAVQCHHGTEVLQFLSFFRTHLV